MSKIWYLPRDILHSVYGEWLKWEDLSSLDRACVEKSEREEWLTSLTDLRKSTVFERIHANKKLKIFYKWLSCRKVFWVEGFSIRLVVLNDLVRVLDMKSYCPAIRSIKIEKWRSTAKISNFGYLKSKLSMLLSHCHNLQGVSLCMSDWHSDLVSVVLSVLVETLRENFLVSISLQDIKANNNEVNVRMTDLLTKHGSSLRYLNMSTRDEVDLDFIVSFLIKNQICLKELIISLLGESAQMMPSLISYISLSGGLLETLKVNNSKWCLYLEDFLTSVAISCPNLSCLAIANCETCNMETLRRLYEKCPHLQIVSVGRFNRVYIHTDEKTKSVSIEVIGQNEDWAICLSHALRRRQYKQVSLRLREDYYHPVGSLKSMLKPCHIELDASTISETSLISLLQDLPHLNSLYLFPSHRNQYNTDAAWSAIAEHGKSLTELRLMGLHFYDDKQLSELIKTCQLLERLTINCCGWESLVAISKLSNLKMVDLTMAESVSKEMLDGLLLDEKVKWSTALKELSIKTYGHDFYYVLANKSHRWVTDC